jgi:hypothetical protein
MPVELDHVFICTDVLAPAAESLLRFGLSEGAPNRHPGQGTANRRFFFQNAFLELLWVDDPVEAQSDIVARTGLWERWSQRVGGASPFGVGLRFSADAAEQLPFASWEYRPPYLPAPLAIQMSTQSHLSTVPLLFGIAFGRRPDLDPLGRRQPLAHSAGIEAVTRLRVSVPNLDPTIAAEWSAVKLRCPAVEVIVGDQHLMEIGFDAERQARSWDFRPALPLILRW